MTLYVFLYIISYSLRRRREPLAAEGAGAVLADPDVDAPGIFDIMYVCIYIYIYIYREREIDRLTD